MQAPPRSPLRPPPQQSSSTSLLGMEQVVPPGTRPTGRLSRASSSYTDKPLPEAPRRSSSIYSDGVSDIIDAYLAESQNEDMIAPPPVVLQPVAYRETIAGLLNRRLEEPPSPTSMASRTSLWARGTPSPVSLAESTSRGGQPLAGRRTRQVKAISPPLPSPSLGFRAINYDELPGGLTGPVSPRITNVVDGSLVPPHLAPGRESSEPERQTSHFSRTSSSGSSLIYNPGIRSSIRSYVRKKLHRGKQSPAEKEKKRIMSFASAKYPHMRITPDERSGRHTSWSSGRRPSIQQGVANAFEKLRKMSIASSGNSSEQKAQQKPRRQKQLAIPTSPYQRYGPQIWEPPKKQKKKKKRTGEPPLRTKREVEEERRRKDDSTPSGGRRHSQYARAFESGTDQLVGAFEQGKRRLKMSGSDKKREDLKRSIKVVGPADHFSPGHNGPPGMI